MAPTLHRRHDRLHRLRQAYRDQAAYASQMERSAARWRRAALAKPKVKDWQPFVFVVAVVCAAIIGLFALPYLAMWLTPPKGC